MSSVRRWAVLGLATVGAWAALRCGPATAFAPAPSPERTREFTNSVGMKLVRVPAGKFTMGSPSGELGRTPDELQHEVEITTPFYLGVYEVTQAEFQKVMGSSPSAFASTGVHWYAAKVRGMDTSKFPVDSVTWAQAKSFCDKLSALPAEKAARRAYRLPTEAEWEYACRAGAKEYAPFHLGKSVSWKQANFDGNAYPLEGERGPYLGRTTTVGSYKPNAWGLYDMHGNVWEWVADWYAEGYYKFSPKKDPRGPVTGTRRVFRGGTWNTYGANLRSARRLAYPAETRTPSFGFRAACVVGAR